MKKLILSFILLLSLLSGIYYLGYTTAGLKMVIRSATHFLPGKLSIKHISGRFADNIEIRDFNYQDPAMQISIDQMNISWLPRHLVNQEIIINQLKANHVDIKINQTQSHSTNSLDDLKSFIIKKSYIDHIAVHYKQQSYLINQLSLDQDVSGTRHINANVLIPDITGLLNHMMKGRISLDLQGDEVIINEAKLTAANALIAFNGKVDKNWNLYWTVNIPDLKNIMPDWSGRLAAKGRMRGLRNNPLLEMSLHTSQLKIGDYSVESIDSNQTLQLTRKSRISLKAKNLRHQDKKLTELSGEITTEPHQKALLVNMELYDNQRNRLAGLITLPKALTSYNLSQPIQGHLKLTLANLSPINLISEEIKNVSGHASADLEINGTLSDPKINAQVDLKNVGLDLPRFAFKIRQLNIHGAMTSSQMMALKGSFRAGKGTGNLEGQLNLNDFNLTTKLTGELLETVDSHEYQITINPNVTFAISPSTMSLTGKVDIPKAHLILNNYYNVVSLPEETTLTNKAAEKNLTMPINLEMNLTVKLGDQIKIAYDKFSGKMTGKILIKQVSGHPATAFGEIHATKGIYQAYGKLLTVTVARLIYSGNALAAPNISIRAQQKFTTVNIQEASSSFTSNTGLQSAYTGSKNIIVGVQLTGSFQRQKVSLFSIPSGLSQGDILSYLTFGQPLSRSQNAGTILSALSSMYTSDDSKIDGITDKLKSSFALSDLSVGSTDIYDPTNNKIVPTTTIGIGKKLGHNLYLHLQVGVLSPVTIFNIRYQFSKHFSLQSETSSIENGADLFYTLETD